MTDTQPKPPPAAVQRLTFEIPVKTVSETNTREHWALKAKRAKGQRQAARLFSAQWTNQLPPQPWRIELGRYGVRRLDTGNLAASMKHVQDGLCDALGIDDGDEAHRWQYGQQQRKKAGGGYGVWVSIETLNGDITPCA